MSKMNCVLLGASNYNFEDQETGRKIAGTKIHFIQSAEKSDRQVGFIPGSANIGFEQFEPLATIVYPVKAELDYEISLTGRRPTFRVNKVFPGEPVKLPAL